MGTGKEASAMPIGLKMLVVEGVAWFAAHLASWVLIVWLCADRYRERLWDEIERLQNENLGRF